MSERQFKDPYNGPYEDKQWDAMYSTYTTYKSYVDSSDDLEGDTDPDYVNVPEDVNGSDYSLSESSIDGDLLSTSASSSPRDRTRGRYQTARGRVESGNFGHDTHSAPNSSGAAIHSTTPAYTNLPAYAGSSGHSYPTDFSRSGTDVPYAENYRDHEENMQWAAHQAQDADSIPHSSMASNSQYDRDASIGGIRHPNYGSSGQFVAQHLQRTGSAASPFLLDDENYELPPMYEANETRMPLRDADSCTSEPLARSSFWPATTSQAPTMSFAPEHIGKPPAPLEPPFSYTFGPSPVHFDPVFLRSPAPRSVQYDPLTLRSPAPRPVPSKPNSRHGDINLSRLIPRARYAPAWPPEAREISDALVKEANAYREAYGVLRLKVVLDTVREKYLGPTAQDRFPWFNKEDARLEYIRREVEAGRLVAREQPKQKRATRRSPDGRIDM